MKTARTTHRQTISVALFLGISLIPTSLVAKEYGVVSGPRAYVVDSKGKINYSQPQHQLVEFDREDGDFLLIPHLNDSRIRKGMVHVLPILGAEQENKPLRYNEQRLLRDAFRILQDAAKLSEEGKHDEASKLGQEAMEKVELLFAFVESPLKAYFMEHFAYLEFNAGKNEQAKAFLDGAERYLKEIKVTEGLAVSELHNIRAIILQTEGKTKEAIELYRKAIDVTKATVGKFHLDYAQLHSNLADAYAEAGDADSAVQAQNESLAVLINLMPKAAIEIPNGYTELGYYLTEDNKHDMAIKAFEIALVDHAMHHLEKDPREVAYTRLGLSDAYHGKEDYAQAKATLEEGMKVELAKMEPADEASYRKEYLYRLARLEYDQERYDQAMALLKEVAQLHEQKTEESIDGTTYTLMGHVHDYQGDQKKAKRAYWKARRIYTRVEGKESDSVKELDEWLAEME